MHLPLTRLSSSPTLARFGEGPSRPPRPCLSPFSRLRRWLLELLFGTPFLFLLPFYGTVPAEPVAKEEEEEEAVQTGAFRRRGKGSLRVRKMGFGLVVVRRTYVVGR